MRQIRQTLHLHFQAGLSYAQVGRALGVPKSTIGKMVSMARAAGVDWARAQTLTDEWAKMEGKSFEQMSAMVDEMAKLTKESLAYQAQLGAEWRKLWLESAKKSAEAMTPPAAKG